MLKLKPHYVGNNINSAPNSIVLVHPLSLLYCYNYIHAERLN